MTHRICITPELEQMLRGLGRYDGPLRRAMREGMHPSEIREEQLWDALLLNSQHAHLVNFSSRLIGREDLAFTYLALLPPRFSQTLHQRYVTQGFLERSDVETAYEQLRNHFKE